MEEGGRREDQIKMKTERQRRENIENLNEMDQLRQEAIKKNEDWKQEKEEIRKIIFQLAMSSYRLER